MRILVLSSNNGEGHNSASRAVIEQAEKRGIFGIMIDTLLFDSAKHSDWVRKIHVNSALRAPGIFKAGNEIAEKMTEWGVEKGKPSACYLANARYAERIQKFIDDNGFDVVVATHIFAAEALTYLRNAGTVQFRSYFIVTDYSCTPFLAETNLDGYFIPNPLMLPYFNEKAPHKNYIPTGIPVSESHIQKTEKQEARRRLGLPQDAPIVMVMTGSMGFGNIAELAQAFEAIMPPETRVLVLCGNNKKLKKNLIEEFGDQSFLQIVDYTDRVGLYLDAADVLVSKPGGLSSTEAAVKEIPLVHTTPLPGWEEDNVSFFTTLGISATGENAQEMAQCALRLLTDEAARAEMARCQREQINKFAARDILDVILRDSFTQGQ